MSGVWAKHRTSYSTLAKKFAGCRRVLATVVEDWSENLFAIAPVRAYAYVLSLGQLDSLATHLDAWRSELIKHKCLVIEGRQHNNQWHGSLNGRALKQAHNSTDQAIRKSRTQLPLEKGDSVLF